MNLSLLAISYFVHLFATVVWIGGMAFMLFVVYPSYKIDDGDSPAWLDALERRFRPFANFSLLVLLMTGVVQMGEDDNYGGFLDFSNDWSRAILAKHIAFIAMIVIVAFLQFGLVPALERAKLIASKSGIQEDVVKLRRRERRLGQINFGLGILVLIFTALATAV